MDLHRLLFPKTIAVIGGRPAAQVIRQNDRLGFDGAIWPVHPTHTEIEGRRAFRDIDDLPGAPDAVFLAVNRHATIDMVARLAQRGAGGVVCYASGFAESGPEGAALQQRLVEAAGSMPLLGPNCYGMLNYRDGAALWPDQHGGRRTPKGVGIITQSGNIGLNLTMQRRGLPIGFLVTLGNQANIGLSHIIRALGQNNLVTAIGLHIEAIDDRAAFAEAAHLSTVPIVVLKTGVSSAGAALTISHTASLAGSDAVTTAFLRRLGVGRVHSLPQLLETLKLLHLHGTLAGTDIVSLSCSGGEAALMADRAEHTAIELRPFTATQRDDVATTVPPLVTVSNPFDYHTFHWADRERLAAIFTSVMRAKFSLTVLILDFPNGPHHDDRDWMIAALALADASKATASRAAVLATLPEGMPEGRARELINIDLVPLCGIDDALLAIETAAEMHTQSGRRLSLIAHLATGTARTLDEWASKCLLAAHGVPIPQGRMAPNADDLIAPCYPAAVKALGIAHKTEHGAVRLNLADANAVTQAARALQPLGTGLLVEEMLDGTELIVGIARDGDLPYLLLGSGGILAELVGDREILLLPATGDEVARALGRLRVYALLAGHRGRPAGNIAAAVKSILAIQSFALANIGTLVELDVNPLIVTPARAVAADALIRMVS